MSRVTRCLHEPNEYFADSFGRRFPLAVEQDHDINPDSLLDWTEDSTEDSDDMEVLSDPDDGRARETSRLINNA